MTPKLEYHPFPPFTPRNARVLIMGTFPPPPSRWSMEFYYPNRINDFWRIMGLIFFDNRDYLLTPDLRNFNLPLIIEFLNEKGIALNDTGHAVRRLKGNASDKFLEIVEPVDLGALLAEMPDCRVVATTGEKAAGVLAELTDTAVPKMGGMVETQWSDGRELLIARMPSTSRAYPMAISKKAEYYRLLMEAAGIL